MATKSLLFDNVVSHFELQQEADWELWWQYPSRGFLEILRSDDASSLDLDELSASEAIQVFKLPRRPAPEDKPEVEHT